MAKITETNIEKLIPDDKNFNKGTEYGQHLIEESLRKFGAGRSILLDKNNRIIAGNKTVENAANVGLENVIIVETDGNQIVAVKRNDIDLDSAKGRELALADNATAKANIEWDEESIQQIAGQWDIKPEEWGVDGFNGDNSEKNPFDDDGIIPKSQYGVIVICEDEQHQERIFKQLTGSGLTCKIVVT